MGTKTTYDWLQDNLTIEKQRDILEKRREYLLQLMPDDVDFSKGKSLFIKEFFFVDWKALSNPETFLF